MVDREVNPMEERHLALSSRFKAAWAFHQLLLAMQRMNPVWHFENKSAAFQSLYGRLKQLSQRLQGPHVGPGDLRPQITALEQELEELRGALHEQESDISTSELRQFFYQIRKLDERVLIEVVRFYSEPTQDGSWDRDRLDKVDFLLSRLAEQIAGGELRGDRSRLRRVLQALSEGAGPVDLDDGELARLTGTLKELESEVRWVKTFEELCRKNLVELYRAVKHDMGGKMFHGQLLPLVVEVNGSFRRKIEALRLDEQRHILEEYQRLTQLRQSDTEGTAHLHAQLRQLQQQFDRFRDESRTGNIRLGELAKLGRSLRAVADRLGGQSARRPADSTPTGGAEADMPRTEAPAPRRSALVPDLELLEPDWNELLASLSGLGPAAGSQQAISSGSLDSFRLEPRELVAFRRVAASGAAGPGEEHFLLAAAAVRRRVCRNVAELRGMQSETPSSVAGNVLGEAREAARVADAYSKHFAHLIDQAIFEARAEEARDLQTLQTRLVRELTGLQNLVSRLLSPSTTSSDGVGSVETTNREPEAARGSRPPGPSSG